MQLETEIRVIAQEVRAFLEPRFPRKLEADGSQVADSAGFCFRAAHLLAHVLNERLGSGQWIPGEGLFASPEVLALMKAGELRRMSDLEDAAQFHGWVMNTGMSLIVDITADQFGLDAILVMNATSEEATGWLPRYFPDRSVSEKDLCWLKEWQAQAASTLTT